MQHDASGFGAMIRDRGLTKKRMNAMQNDASGFGAIFCRPLNPICDRLSDSSIDDPR
jgi:hypothetical protein